MIIDKFFNYKINTFTITAQVIQLMKRKKTIQLDVLFNEIISINTDINHDIILEALGILFLTGKIEYNLETDKMELLK